MNNQCPPAHWKLHIPSKNTQKPFPVHNKILQSKKVTILHCNAPVTFRGTSHKLSCCPPVIFQVPHEFTNPQMSGANCISKFIKLQEVHVSYEINKPLQLLICVLILCGHGKLWWCTPAHEVQAALCSVTEQETGQWTLKCDLFLFSSSNKGTRSCIFKASSKCI